MTTKTTAPSTAKKPAKAAAKSATLAPSKTTKKPVAKPATAAGDKKDVQKLQRAIFDGLEDVKAQEIVVFDTEHLSSLFERVIVASGTSNRQTKALAMSVIDAVRDAGFPKPRVEGEANGEWIIVDCGQAVVHVMQPTYRSYYNLEELWGEKPVRLKFGAAKPAVASEPSAAQVKAAKDAAKPAASLRRSSAAKQGVQEAFPSRAQMAKTAASEAAAAKKAAAKSAATPKRKVADTAAVAKPRLKTVVVNAPVKPAAKKTAAKTVASKAPAKKPAVRKA
jgi:ribosome-associated protein